VEAAGIEPAPGRLTNRLMAHDFARKTSIPSRFSPSIESPAVPSCPLESTPVVEIFWRRPWCTRSSRPGSRPGMRPLGIARSWPLPSWSAFERRTARCSPRSVAEARWTLVPESCRSPVARLAAEPRELRDEFEGSLTPACSPW